MPLRRVALLCLATCGPAPDLHVEVTPADASRPVPTDSSAKPVPTDSSPNPVPKDSSAKPVPTDSSLAAPLPTDSSAEPVPTDSSLAAPPAPDISHLGRPVPGVSPTLLRLLHADVFLYAPLTGGAMLVERRGVPELEHDPGVERLDLATGALTPWAQAWTPEAAGWRTRPSDWDPGFPVVSADGHRVAVGHSFAARTLPPDHRAELTAIVVSRGDGSEPRCIGVGVPSDDPPPFYWSHDGRRLLGDWTLACAPDRRGLPVPLHPDRPDTFLVSMPWLDLIDGRTGELPYRFVYEGRDPLSDRVVDRFADTRGVGLESFDLATGAALGLALEDEAHDLVEPVWVSADAFLVEVMSDDRRTSLGQRVTFVDGRSIPLTGPAWTIYTRLPGDQLLLSRDDGRTVLQARVDWHTGQVLSSRPRPELAQFAAPDPEHLAAIWRPGLGGVLIHAGSGALYLAAI